MRLRHANCASPPPPPGDARQAGRLIGGQVPVQKVGACECPRLRTKTPGGKKKEGEEQRRVFNRIDVCPRTNSISNPTYPLSPSEVVVASSRTSGQPRPRGHMCRTRGRRKTVRQAAWLVPPVHQQKTSSTDSWDDGDTVPASF